MTISIQTIKEGGLKKLTSLQVNVQVKSKKRVSDHGEVFTSDREVNAMLDLVKQETERIDSRFLEPACGTGNFLVEILKRKLAVVKNKYRKVKLEYERYAIVAVSSIYGIDILEDNTEVCRQRLFDIFYKEYKTLFKENCNDSCLKSVKYILERNILTGDALTLKTVDGKKPITFSEWTVVNGSMIKQRDYTLENLLESQPIDIPNLFSDLGEKVFIPTPIKEFPLTHFLKLAYEVAD